MRPQKPVPIKSYIAHIFWAGLFLFIFIQCDPLQNLSVLVGSDTSDKAKGGNPPQDFNLLYPPNESVDISLTTNFSWEQATDPEGGKVRYILSLQPALGGSIKVISVFDTRYTLTNPLLPNTSYYWRVTAEDPAGNVTKTPFFKFTTASEGGSGGGGGGTPELTITPLASLNQSSIRKGVLLHHPNFPNYLVYLYIHSTNLNVYSRTSTDGGSTWGSPIQINDFSNARDFAAAMDHFGQTVGIFLDDADDDTGKAGRIANAYLPYNSSYWEILTYYMGTPYGRNRLPNVYAGSDRYLFAFGEELQLAQPDDAYANSLYWNANTHNISEVFDVGLDDGTDTPIHCQQIAFDPSANKMYYLYFDTHLDGETEGGDIFVIEGYYPNDWGGETRILDYGDNQIPNQGFLFRGNGGDLILVYGLQASGDNTLYYRHAPTLSGLASAPDAILDYSLQVPSDIGGRYRTLYAAQDSSGNIHLVWEDTSHIIKWVKINSSTYTSSASTELTINAYIDGISLGGNKLYVSTKDVTSFTSKVIVIENF
ncbi:MAG: fibronectin type III domain-containing protein [Spirochaetales bacterium]